MSEKKVKVTIHGKRHTFKVLEDRGTFSTEYHVRRDDGEVWGTYPSLSDAVRAAHEKAGPDAYETQS